jgi:hypothetical protein
VRAPKAPQTGFRSLFTSCVCVVGVGCPNKEGGEFSSPLTYFGRLRNRLPSLRAARRVALGGGSSARAAPLVRRGPTLSLFTHLPTMRRKNKHKTNKNGQRNTSKKHAQPLSFDCLKTLPPSPASNPSLFVRACAEDMVDYTGNAGMEEDDCCDEFEITVGAAQVQLTRIA